MADHCPALAVASVYLGLLLLAILSLRSLFGGHENGTTPKTDNHQPVFLKGQPAEKRVTHRLASLFPRQFHLDHECLLNRDSEIIPPRCHRVAIRLRTRKKGSCCGTAHPSLSSLSSGKKRDCSSVASDNSMLLFQESSEAHSCSPAANETTVRFASLFFRLRLLVGTHRGDRSPLDGTAAGSELIHPAPFHAHPLSSFCSSSAVESAAAFPVLTHTVSVRITSNIVWVDVVIVMV